ncbi:NlpC/P60 family protein [Bacillaceae bacterium CLA-AA-H227]|uniref:Peptidase n=2 Tax=Robertmurraya TaxID=2837507 RepID=A0A4U1CY89_9BACI|nr:C40 family peptidase [Robertmurraya kyonggiensis]TKC15009.1 peptidase [Robertmurraya kyonggiensis]
MLKKKLLVLNTSIILGVGSLISIPSVSAEYSTQIQQVEKTINDTENKLSVLKEKVKKTDIAIQENNKLIAQTESDIKMEQAEIQKLEEEIKVLNETIAKRTEILKSRAQSFQESGGKVSYIEVLLGSEDFSDFIDRVFAVSQIANADSDLIKQHELDKAAVEEKQTEVKKKLEELTGKKTELDGMKSLLLQQKEQNDTLKNDLEEAQKGNKAKLSELEAKVQAEQEAQKVTQKVTVQNTSSSSKESNSNSGKSGGKVAYTPPANDGSLNTVLTAGNKYIGNSVYVFGGGRNAYDIANGRFDCSAFVSWAFRQAGISIGSSTEALRTQGTKISLSEARPGDLVFFDTYKRDGHVAIYLGGGKFIGSQSSTGVAIANMNSGYYQKTFKGHVRRVANF